MLDFSPPSGHHLPSEAARLLRDLARPTGALLLTGVGHALTRLGQASHRTAQRVADATGTDTFDVFPDDDADLVTVTETGVVFHLPPRPPALTPREAAMRRHPSWQSRAGQV